MSTPPLYALGKLTVGAALRLCWRPAVHDVHHVPRAGGAILAGNHLSVADELFLAAVTPRHIAFWAKAEYFTGTGPLGRLTRAAVRGMGAIRVERGGGRAVLFGEPIDVAGHPDRPGAVRALTDEVMSRIQTLTGQQYVPRYAPRRDTPAR